VKPTSNLFGRAIWQRGGLLGLIWLGLFAAITVVLYLLMGIIGWDGTARVLCAMILGPLLGIGVIVGWWVIRRPMLAPAADRPDREGEEI
jgi:hypothetical protein